MAALGRFGEGLFAVGWNCRALVFVDDVRKVFREVARVLKPGGTYVTSTMHPTTLRLYGTFTGAGWRPRTSYFDDRAMPSKDEADLTWQFGRVTTVAPTLALG